MHAPSSDLLLPHSTLLVYLKTAPRSLLVLYFLLKLSLEIDCDRMAFFHINIDKILRLRSKRQLLRKFLVDFCQQQNIPVVGTCIEEKQNSSSLVEIEQMDLKGKAGSMRLNLPVRSSAL